MSSRSTGTSLCNRTLSTEFTILIFLPTSSFLCQESLHEHQCFNNTLSIVLLYIIDTIMNITVPIIKSKIHSKDHFILRLII